MRRYPLVLFGTAALVLLFLVTKDSGEEDALLPAEPPTTSIGLEEPARAQPEVAPAPTIPDSAPVAAAADALVARVNAEVGERPSNLRPLDDSDPEMRALLSQAYTVGASCAPAEKPCRPALDLLRMGGDRLATYLIAQYEKSLAEGYPNRLTYLTHIAQTRSDVGYEYVLARVRDREELGFQDWEFAVRALSHSGDPRALEEAKVLLATEENLQIRVHAINTFWRVAEVTGEVDPEAFAILNDIKGNTQSSEERPRATNAVLRLERLANPEPQ